MLFRSPKNALLEQYRAMVETEGATIEYTDDGVEEVARIATELNERMENIGARRLQTVMTTVLEELMFDLPEVGTAHVLVDAAFVRERLKDLAEDEDLRRFIL